MSEQPDTGTRSPSRSPWHISRIPGHLGRARTSTLVLAVLFVAIFALYLYVRPDMPGTTADGTSNQAPAATTAPAQETTAPTRTPTTTSEPTQDQPETTDTATPTEVPTRTSTPEGPTDSTTPSTTTLPTATLSSPAG